MENYSHVIKKIAEEVCQLYDQLDVVQIESRKKFIAFLKEEDQCLKQMAFQRPSQIGITSQLTVDQRVDIKERFCQLTSTKGWKITPKMVAWIEFVPEDEQRVNALVGLLRKEGIGTVAVSKRKDNGNPILTCSNINLRALNQLTTDTAEFISSFQKK